MTSVTNTNLGINSFDNATGEWNTAIGAYSVSTHNVGSSNVGLGGNALLYNNTGGFNTAVGTATLLYNTTGNLNTALGSNSMENNASGMANTCLGVQALYVSSSWDHNTVVGYQGAYQAMSGFNTAIGSFALFNLGENGENVAVGYKAGFYNKGSNNTFLGTNTGPVSGDTTNYQNSTVIGSGAILDASNQILLGTSAETVKVPGNLTFTGTINGVSATTFNYISGTTSNIQTQITSLQTKTSGISQSGSTTTINEGLTVADNFVVQKRIDQALNGSNVQLGTDSLVDYTSGSANTCIGFSSGKALTTGSNNTAVGMNAGINTTTGTDNTMMGVNALYNNTTGNYNTAIGGSALNSNTSGGENTCIGFNSGKALTTGSNNTAVGMNAGINTTTGIDNTMMGVNALYNNTTGNYNTAIGGSALNSNTLGGENVAIGYFSGVNNTTGYFNTSVGDNAFHDNTTGVANTAIGRRSLNNNTTGADNTSVGHSAGQYNTSGGKNTFIGYNAGPASGFGTYVESTAVGHDAVINGSNQIVIGTSSEITYIPGSSIQVGSSTNRISIGGGLGVGDDGIGIFYDVSTNIADIRTQKQGVSWGTLELQTPGGTVILGNHNTANSVKCFASGQATSYPIAPQPSVLSATSTQTISDDIITDSMILLNSVGAIVITVPSPSTRPGMRLNLYNSNGTSYTISTPLGDFKGAGFTTATSYVSSVIHSTYTIQSTGADWIFFAKNE